MQTLLLLFMVVWTFFIVALRRSIKGPLHPGWTYRYEALVGVVRRALEGGRGRHPAAMRRGIAAARLHPSIRPLVRWERSTLAGLATENTTPIAWRETDPTLLYFHGGGYIVCSPATHRDLIGRIVAASGARCIAVDYRKAPEHAFPAAIDDAEAAYRAVLDSGVDPSLLFVGGDSAGGGLTLALLQRVREHHLPTARAAVLLSPWVDLECTGDSIRTNAPYDYLPADALDPTAEHYLQGGDRRHPHASAVHANFTDFPPLLIQTGGAELFLSENTRLAEVALKAGVAVTHEVEPGMVHVFQAFASFHAECEPAIARIGAFIRSHAARA